MVPRFRKKEQNILAPAAEKDAEFIDEGGGNSFVMAQAVDCMAAVAVAVDQLIGCQAAFLHGFPERIVYDHFYHPVFSIV